MSREVDESKAEELFTLQIHWQRYHVIVFLETSRVHDLKQLFARVLVGDVVHHHGCIR